MKVVSYNIQYGTGLDGRYDIGRIAEAVRDADVIALQEVCRNNPRNGGRDMVAELTAALPDRFFVYGPNFEADIGSQVVRHFARTARAYPPCLACCQNYRKQAALVHGVGDCAAGFAELRVDCR